MNYFKTLINYTQFLNEMQGDSFDASIILSKHSFHTLCTNFSVIYLLKHRTYRV